MNKFRKRKHISRTRDGCETCKERHLKCDEGRPSCSRCVHARRTCVYTPVSVRLAITGDLGTLQEQRALHAYRQLCAPRMSNYFDGPFWTATVLRVSYSNEAIRHIITANGAYFEALTHPMYSMEFAKERDFSLHQASRAARLLVEGSLRANTYSTILTCCILFATWGLMVDGFSHLQHVKGGLDIFREVSSDPNHYLSASLTASEKDLVYNLLVPMLHRLANVSTTMEPISAAVQSIRSGGLLSCKSDPKVHAIPDTSTVFSSIRQAELWHSRLLRWVLSKLQLSSTAPSGYVLPDFFAEYFHTASQHFLENIDQQFISHSPSKLGNDVIEAAQLLKSTHIATRLSVAAFNFTTECQWDEHESDFEQIVDSCEACMVKPAKKKDPGPLRNFGTDHSVIIPLFMVARCARNPILRRKALGLLKSTYIVEGMKGSRVSATICEALMDLEEVGLANIKSATDIPECKRVRFYDASFINTSPVPVATYLRIRVEQPPYSRHPHTEASHLFSKTIWLRLDRIAPPIFGAKEKLEYYIVNHSRSAKDTHAIISKEQNSRATIKTISAGEFHLFTKDAEKYSKFTIGRTSVTWAANADTTIDSLPEYRSLQLTHPFLEKFQHILEF